MPNADRPTAWPRAAVIGAVLALHLLLIGNLPPLRIRHDRGTKAAAPGATISWLLQPAPLPSLSVPSRQQMADAALAPAAARRTPVKPVRRPVEAPAPTATPTVPDARRLPPASTAAPSSAPYAPAPSPPVARIPSPAPLNLVLPKGAAARFTARSPALTDPRANSIRETLESAVASAMGDATPWTVEIVDDDHRLMRRGSECVTVERTKADQLEPFNRTGFGGRPWLVGPSRKCR